MLVKSLEMWTESTLKLNFPLTFLTWHPTLPSTCTGAINLPLDGRLSDLMVIWRELSILSPEYPSDDGSKYQKNRWVNGTAMKTGSEANIGHLSRAMSACVENGQRLHQDAELLGSDQSTTAVALCILAQEEFAKAFLLHLVCEGVIPWTAKVRASLRNHRHKQLMGLIMEWLSPSDEEYSRRIEEKRYNIVPLQVADAMKLFVEEVQPEGHISCPPTANDPRAKKIAVGNRDKVKQDALYVRLSEDGKIISQPMQVSPETIEEELDKTNRLSNLVGPLRAGCLGPVLNYHLILEAMNFLLLDKRKRPFLILKETEFGGQVLASNGTTWSHSINVFIENISEEKATRVNGHATVLIDMVAVRPSFRFNQFTVEPYSANQFIFFISEETHASGTSPGHKLDLYIALEYHGITSDRKYHIRMWSTYDSSKQSFIETSTDVQELATEGSSSQGELETKWTQPSTT